MSQLLKWIGNKQRMAAEIASCFPKSFGTYHEPFLGSGALLGVLTPQRAIASDGYRPLIEIWQCLKADPNCLAQWYEERYHTYMKLGKKDGYGQILASFNSNPNGADLVFLCRACYGGVVRFRKADGYMSTPVGAHTPVSPESFHRRAHDWFSRVKNTSFENLDYREAMDKARAGDLIYCDPPYAESQSILYGAQRFRLAELLEMIAICKTRGAHVALSIDGTKRSGLHVCKVPIPDGLFAQDLPITVGRSMLKRFQSLGEDVRGAVVTDRLLITT